MGQSWLDSLHDKINKMRTNTKFFMGIDVSKPYFDAAVLPVTDHQKQAVETARFDNTSAGMILFEKWLVTLKVPIDEHTLLVIENTGIYHRLLWAFCTKKNIPIHIGNAAHIKWSFGIARGKNDKIDSVRLCNYAHKHSDELKASPELDPVLMQLKDLITSRSRLLSQVNSIKTYIQELRTVSDKGVQKVLEQAHKAAIAGIARSIKSVEAEITRIITENKAFKKNFDLLRTVPGIGTVTAVYMICCTNNFAGKISGKQLACYAGVVPFENTSGISVRERKRVHKMANKELKTLLHMCSMTTIQKYDEFKIYYARKKEEGKNSMSILNAIRNKIVLRAVAVVNNQTPYVDKTKSMV